MSIGQERLSPHTATNSMVNFVRSVTQEQVRDAFEPSLIRYGEAGFSESMPYPIEAVLNLKKIKAEKLSPDWLRLPVFINTISRMNSSYFWLGLIAQNPELEKGLENYTESQGRLKIATQIEINNARFATMATVTSTLGTVFGEKVKEAINPEKRIFRIKEHDTRGYAAAVEIGDHFKTQPSDSDELIRRLQILFPVPEENNVSNENSLLSTLARHNAFEISQKGVIKQCPAVKLTSFMFEEYGRLVRTPNYQQLLKSSIVRQN